MRKKIIVMLTACIMTATGCTPIDTEVTNEEEIMTQESKTEAEENEPLEEAAEDSGSSAAEENVSGDAAEFSDKYLEAVQAMYKDNVGVEGEALTIGESTEGNQFAIADVDGDGADELVIKWEGTCMADMIGHIYQYDSQKDTFIDEGVYSYLMEFYNNGVVKANWYHNQGGSELWPYDAYKYNPEIDKYEQVLCVDSMSENIAGSSFPSDIDKDGAGVVYYISKDNASMNYENPVSQSEYDAKFNEYFSGASEMKIDYYEISDKGVEQYKASK